MPGVRYSGYLWFKAIYGSGLMVHGSGLMVHD